MKWHPSVDYCLASISQMNNVRIWDVNESKMVYTFNGNGKDPTSLAWNYDGSQLVSITKAPQQRFVTIVDPRQPDTAVQVPSPHEGFRDPRLVWDDPSGKMISVGQEGSERQYCVWDPKNMSKPLFKEKLMESAGTFFYTYLNPNNNIFYVSAKGS